MPRVLSLSLRPRTLSGLFGQETLIKAIRHHVATRQPRTWMFWGSPGTGKTTLARIMSVAYQCTHMQQWGDPCKECWDKRDSFAIHEINASENSGVKEMGDIVQAARFAPLMGSKRVFILDEAHLITPNAQSLMLKPLEEPPESTIWIVCTNEPDKLRAAMKRRPTTYRLKSLSISERARFLTKAAAVAKITQPLDDLVEQVNIHGIGEPGVLLQALEKFAACSNAEEAVLGASGVSINSLRICQTLVSGDWETLRGLLMVAANDEARFIRASVAGYIRAILVRERSPKIQERCAASIIELMSNAPIDDVSMMYWLWATLFRICRKWKDQ